MPPATQSILTPAGPHAGHVAWLWWLMLWVTSSVYVVVLAAAVMGAWRARAGSQPASETRLRTWIGAGTAATLLILVGLLVASELTGRAVQSMQTAGALPIEIIGHRWWWEIRYWPKDPVRFVMSANELHVPVGRPIELSLSSADVIHSFWAPNVAGKMDLVPGRTNALVFQVDAPGRWHGQCAEYCGIEHAKMRFTLVADEPRAFDAWLDHERAPAAAPAGDTGSRALALLDRSACVQCHTISGTSAKGQFGPDLTHVGSREYLAAGALRVTPDNLRRWLLDPQGVKPGNQMPRVPMSDQELTVIAAYLGTLK